MDSVDDLLRIKSKQDIYNQEVFDLFVKGRRVTEAMMGDPGRALLSDALVTLSENIHKLISFSEQGFDENLDRIKQTSFEISAVMKIILRWSVLIKSFYAKEEAIKK